MVVFDRAGMISFDWTRNCNEGSRMVDGGCWSCAKVGSDVIVDCDCVISFDWS